MYQGILTLYFSLASFIVSDSASNSDFSTPPPILNVPLGATNPSHVPCPRAIVTPAYFPLAARSEPAVTSIVKAAASVV